jgi:predicted transcriptional regulator
MSTPVFLSKPTAQWMEEASLKPVPEMLFSEFWFEGELCILFADTNVGKSILAVQIGDSISKGISIEGFKLQAERQKVLYFDFELSDKQLETRYSDSYENHYEFDEHFIRSEINADTEMFLSEQVLQEALESEIVSQEAKIVIIDNLTYLSQESEKAKYALSLMKHFKGLKSKYNLSFLILAHTPKRDFNRPISNNDLQGSKMLISFCDSSFAIGKSYSDTSLRYIKQIKQRNCEQIYHEDNVCLCTLSKGKNNNFLQFKYLQQGQECKHLNIELPLDKQAKIEDARALKAEGWTNTRIAEKHGVTEGAVRKWL